MSQRLTPIKRRELIKRLRWLGWEGPFPGGSHHYMKKQAHTIPIPSYAEIDSGKLREMLQEFNISREEWLSAAR